MNLIFFLERYVQRKRLETVWSRHEQSLQRNWNAQEWTWAHLWQGKTHLYLRRDQQIPPRHGSRRKENCYC